MAASLDASIRAKRAGERAITILRDGVPVANAPIVVRQVSHAFLFGCIGFEFVELANDELVGADLASRTAVAERWLDVFNFATLPFYWSRFEPVRGCPDTARLRAAAEWFAARGIPVKGHPLAWHTLAPDWLLPLDDGEVEAAQRGRIEREVSGFRGLIDAWDAINEVAIMPIYDRDSNAITRLCRRIGRIPTVRLAFETARAANPAATLLLNDFDMSAAYECLIEGCLEAGIRIDALGLQSHMHQGYWGEEKTVAILDRFARFGLPIHFTESTLVSGRLMPPGIEDLNDYQPPEWPTTPQGEERQADEVVRHYKTLLSHPAVEAITYWGISDGGWLGAPSGFLRVDGSPKPSFEALRSLVKGEWWLPETEMRTDERGRIRVSGFFGEYEVRHAGCAGSFRLEKGGVADTVVELR